ncbi:UNVERIFIED_CONTAM: hypothetical protein K2H54_043284 [Gekko kuhli]
MISSHAEILENASPEAVDADEKERHESVDTAITWIDESFNELLEGLQPTDQYKVDELLGEKKWQKRHKPKELWSKLHITSTMTLWELNLEEP